MAKPKGKGKQVVNVNALANKVAGLVLKKKAQNRRPRKVSQPRQHKRRQNMAMRTRCSYKETLMSPFNCRGARIPDLMTVPSCVAETYNEQSITTVLDSGVANSYNYVFVLGPDNTLGVSPSGGIPITSNVPTSVALNPVANNSTLQAAFENIRLVSAGASLLYTGNALNGAGTVTAALVPKSQFGVTFSLATLKSMPGAQTRAVLPEQTFHWSPMDSADYEYWTAASGVSTSLPDYYYLIVWVNTPAALNFELAYTWNWEAIPKTLTSALSPPEPSRADVRQLEEAANLMGSRSCITEVEWLTGPVGTSAGTGRGRAFRTGV
jgi:hypothetical protein